VAERLARGSLSRDRGDVQSLNLLALIAVRRGESARGASLLRRSLDIAPFDREASEILANLEEANDEKASGN